MIESPRIVFTSANGEVKAFADNLIPDAPHYTEAILDRYFTGDAATLQLTLAANYKELYYVREGDRMFFTYQETDYAMTIMAADHSDNTITYTGMSLSLELNSNEAEEWKNEDNQFKTFREYLTMFDSESSITLGKYELDPNETKNLHYDSPETLLARIISLADSFNAEIEFVTEVDNYFGIKSITLNVYHMHDDEHQGLGTTRPDFRIDYGKDVTGVTRKGDIHSLKTAIRPIGKDGMNLIGTNYVEYDKDGKTVKFYSPTESGWIYAPLQRDKFPSNLTGNNRNDRYIMATVDYSDAEQQGDLYARGLVYLKSVCEPSLSYDVDGYFPDLRIGDMVIIYDSSFDPMLIVEARVYSQSINITDPDQSSTVFSNFKELKSQLATSVTDIVNELIAKNKVYVVNIVTDNGIIFKNNEGTTRLTASVYENGMEKINLFNVRWFKDGTFLGTGKYIDVKASDINTQAVYRCDIYDALSYQRGTSEVTVTNVVDGQNGTNGKDGVNGAPGKDGSNGLTAYFHTAWANNGTGTLDFSRTDPTGRSYIGTYSDYTASGSTDPSKYNWQKVLGDAGIAGPKGEDGKTLYTWIKYADTPTSGMSDSPAGKKYVGIAYNKSTVAESTNYLDYAWSLIKGDDGVDGKDGADGKDGTDGKDGAPGTPGIDAYSGYLTTEAILLYGDSSGVVTDYSTAVSSFEVYRGQSRVTTGVTYSKVSQQGIECTIDSVGNIKVTKATAKVGTATFKAVVGTVTLTKILTVAVAVMGLTGTQGQAGTDGVGIDFTTITYQAGSSGTTPPTGTWTSTVPSVTANQYLWTRTITTYTDNSTTTAYSIGKMGANGTNGSNGTDGKDGTNGTDGRGITSTVITYQAGTSGTTPPTGTWTTTIPTVTANQYLWTRSIFTYTDATTSTAYSIGKIGANGSTGATGPAGPPTGITVSTTEPTTKYVNMLWKNTGTSGGRIKDATYRWNGSAWELYLFSAANIAVDYLSAIVANLGTVTAGNINSSVTSSGQYVRGFKLNLDEGTLFMSSYIFDEDTINRHRQDLSYDDMGLKITDYIEGRANNRTHVRINNYQIAFYKTIDTDPDDAQPDNATTVSASGLRLFDNPTNFTSGAFYGRLEMDVRTPSLLSQITPGQGLFQSVTTNAYTMATPGSFNVFNSGWDQTLINGGSIFSQYSSSRYTNITPAKLSIYWSGDYLNLSDTLLEMYSSSGTYKTTLQQTGVTSYYNNAANIKMSIDSGAGRITSTIALLLTATSGSVNLQGASVNVRNATNSGWSTVLAAGFSSQSAYSSKEKFRDLDMDDLLNAVKRTDIVEYKFKGSEDRTIGFVLNDDGISPYVTDELIGNNMRGNFDVTNVLGVLMGSIKALNAKVEYLEEVIANGTTN